MLNDRNKFSFVTILLLISANVITSQATSNAQQQEANQPQQQQPQTQNDAAAAAAIATVSVVNNKDKEDEANAIVNEPANDVVRAFSPRLDYSNEWRPVGRGDPLKNDPTFDYSPPTLEHVRYWAETTKDTSKEDSTSSSSSTSNNNKRLELNGIHINSNKYKYHHQQQQQHPNAYAYHQQHLGLLKNAKGETPILQPKYSSVRRSYYAQQLPTRLMPPPMQANPPSINTFNVPMKPSPMSQMNTEYRHSMSGSPQAHISTMPSMGGSQHQMAPTSYMKGQHYAAAAGMSTPSSLLPSWMYNSPSTSMQHQHQQQHRYVMSTSTVSSSSKPTTQQTSRMPMPSHAYDTHSQDTHHHFSYMHPAVGMSGGISSHSPHESYSPNSLHHNANNIKQQSGGIGRKPWLHELLQKEVVKTSVKPPSYMTSTHHKVSSYEITKPIYERMPSTSSYSGGGGGFTPYTPVTFVPAPPTIATTSLPSSTTTTSATTTTTRPAQTQTTSAMPITISTKLVSYTTSTTRPTATTTPRTTTSSTTTSRLLIPTTSNLAYRPTVAPMQMTTDSLFSHYKQPEAPLRGPMYLIIEGHSKVKKYGKNGINLNLPKIVPVVPKREPVVRMAEPGEEKRGTPETFHVEHLHVKSSTPATMSTTTTTATATATTSRPKTTASTTTTSKPSSSHITSLKPVPPTKPTAVPNPKKATLKPPVVSVTTTAVRPAATTASPRTNNTIAGKKDADMSEATKSAEEIASPLKLNMQNAKPARLTNSANNAPLIKLELPNEPPTGMQGLLSLLDSSLGSLFAEQPLDLTEMPMPATAQFAQTNQTTATHLTTPSTILQAVNLTQAELGGGTGVGSTQAAALVPLTSNAHIGTSANRILAADGNGDGSEEFIITTDMPPREVRQVYDYDQRPESRLKDFAIDRRIDDGMIEAEEAMDESASTFYDEDEFEEYEDENDTNHDQNPIKRFDKLIDASVAGNEGEFVGDYEEVELKDLGVSLGDVQMQAKMT